MAGRLLGPAHRQTTPAPAAPRQTAASRGQRTQQTGLLVPGRAVPLPLRRASTMTGRGQTNEVQRMRGGMVNRMYAVAVRDGGLFLVACIERSPSGDVYVLRPRNQPKEWNPHASYHASGQHHHKSFNHKM